MRRMEERIMIIKSGQEYEHKNGRIYKVLFITNTANPSHQYPPDVVYESVVNGNKWSRPLSKFTSARFKLVKDVTV